MTGHIVGAQKRCGHSFIQQTRVCAWKPGLEYVSAGNLE